MSFGLVNRKGAKKRHLIREERKVREFPSRYEATAMCGAKFGGEYHSSRGEASDVGCSECLVSAIRMSDRKILDWSSQQIHHKDGNPSNNDPENLELRAN